MKRAALLAIVLPALYGCPQCPPEAVSLDRLLGEYNTNAAAVPRLWARARIRLELFEPGSVLPFVWDSAESSGILLLSKGPEALGPHDFVLIGREVGQDLFRLGSDAAEGVYYFWYAFGNRRQAWLGHTALAGAPGVKGLPLDPHQLLAVLCISELPQKLDALPVVALEMETEPDKCAYVVTYIDRQPVSGRILFKRRMYFKWAKDKPRRPFRVDFLDAQGRRIVTADLKNYAPIDAEEAEASGHEAPALMPTDIKITWIDPRTHKKTSSVRLWLSKMTTEDKWDRDAVRFRPPEGCPVVHVDQGLGGKGNLP